MPNDTFTMWCPLGFISYSKLETPSCHYVLMILENSFEKCTCHGLHIFIIDIPMFEL